MNRSCNSCSKFMEALSDGRSKCMEWKILGGGVVKESYYERKSTGCRAYKKTADEQEMNIERGLSLSDSFFVNQRRFNRRKKKNDQDK